MLRCRCRRSRSRSRTQRAAASPIGSVTGSRCPVSWFMPVTTNCCCFMPRRYGFFLNLQNFCALFCTLAYIFTRYEGRQYAPQRRVSAALAVPWWLAHPERAGSLVRVVAACCARVARARRATSATFRWARPPPPPPFVRRRRRRVVRSSLGVTVLCWPRTHTPARQKDFLIILII